MTQYNIQVSEKAASVISSFYYHVAQKWKNTYALEDVERYIEETIGLINGIERHFLPREPRLDRWKQKGYLMAHVGRWYFAYRIDGDTIYVEDACHQQNMSNSQVERS